jgi:5'-3' exonuclease
MSFHNRVFSLSAQWGCWATIRSLPREEVKLGSHRKKEGTPDTWLFYASIRYLMFICESINFYLLHLSLMRKYLDLKFRDVEPTLTMNIRLQLQTRQ